MEVETNVPVKKVVIIVKKLKGIFPITFNHNSWKWTKEKNL